MVEAEEEWDPDQDKDKGVEATEEGEVECHHLEEIVEAGRHRSKGTMGLHHHLQWTHDPIQEVARGDHLRQSSGLDQGTARGDLHHNLRRIRDRAQEMGNGDLHRNLLGTRDQVLAMVRGDLHRNLPGTRDLVLAMVGEFHRGVIAEVPSKVMALLLLLVSHDQAQDKGEEVDRCQIVVVLAMGPITEPEVPHNNRCNIHHSKEGRHSSNRDHRHSSSKAGTDLTNDNVGFG